MPNAKTSTFSLNTRKSFLAKHLINDNDNDNFKLFKGDQHEQIQDKFLVLSSSSVRNLVTSFKHHPMEATLTTFLN
jgi:hypothetical protein